jgi:hypothetical protein
VFTGGSEFAPHNMEGWVDLTKAQLHNQLTAFYQKYEPSKIPEVSNLLANYKV